MAVVTVTIDCSGGDSPTQARSDAVTVFDPGVAIATVLSNDFYEGEFTLSTTGLPAQFAFDTATGAVTLLPGAPFGEYVFAYTLCADGGCDSALVTVVYANQRGCSDADQAVFSPC